MNATEVIRLAQNGHKEFRELLAPLSGLYATNPRELAYLISRHVDAAPKLASAIPKPVDRSALRDIAVQFHIKAGTLTESVHDNIELFVRGAPILRIAHQPNTFAYLGVYAQFIYLDSLARSLLSHHQILPCQIYLVADFDNAGDKRFRISHFPDVERRGGSVTFSAPVPSDSYDKVQWAIGKPSQREVSQWVSLLQRLVRHNLTVLRRRGIPEKEPGQVQQWLKTLEQQIWEAHSRSSNLPEFNAIFLSRLINLHWRLPTAFFSLTKVVRLMRSYYEYLLQRYPTLVRLSNQVIDLLQSKSISIPDSLRLDLDTFPIWYLCPKCNARVRLRFVSGTRFIVEGVCPMCASKYRYDLGTQSAPDLGEVYDKMIPRIALHELGDVIGLAISGGVGYRGGAEHVFVSGLVASRLGWNVPPETLWHPKGIHYGLAETRAAQIMSQVDDQRLSKNAEKAVEMAFCGRANILYYVLSQGFDGLLNMWKHHFESGGCVTETNIGPSFFVIPKDSMSALEDQMMCLLGQE